MLQTDSAPLSGMAQRGQADGGIGGIINFGVGFIRRQYLVAIVTAALGLVGAVIYLLITPATYSAQAQIILANPPQFVSAAVAYRRPSFDVSQIETQLQIIKSRPIAIAVINQLKLEDDRDFRASRPSFFSELWHRILTWVSPQPNDPQVAAADQPPEDVIKEFLERLSTSRVDFSNVIEVSFTSSAPSGQQKSLTQSQRLTLPINSTQNSMPIGPRPTGCKRDYAISASRLSPLSAPSAPTGPRTILFHPMESQSTSCE